MRYNVDAGEWFVYDSKVWVKDVEGMRVALKMKELADALLVYTTSINDEDKKQAYLIYINKLGQFNHRATIIKDAKSLCFISQHDFDNNFDLFNCQNGTLNLKTLEFKSHDAQDLISKISNVVYDPKATAPIFEAFIDTIMRGNADKMEYLQKILGYSLTAGTELETCFILYGATTRNGKSTLVETISYMMGNADGYALAMPPQTLARADNRDVRRASGDIARLDKCRFLNASEPPKRMNFDVALLKTLLGRDSITARHLYEREFEFIPHFKLFINTNFLPLIADDSLFTSGRINVISFDRHFEDHEQDKGLKDRLRRPEIISGIFNWCVDGLKKYRIEGATPPEAITATAEYRRNSDKIGCFINDCLEYTGRNSKAGNIYKIYKDWCIINGFGVENKSNFFDELKTKGLCSDKATVGGATVKNAIVGYELQEGCWLEPYDGITPFDKIS